MKKITLMLAILVTTGCAELAPLKNAPSPTPLKAIASELKATLKKELKAQIKSQLKTALDSVSDNNNPCRSTYPAEIF